MLRLVLACAVLACVAVLVGVPLLIVWLAKHDAMLDPGDVD